MERMKLRGDNGEVESLKARRPAKKRNRRGQNGAYRY